MTTRRQKRNDAHHKVRGDVAAHARARSVVSAVPDTVPPKVAADRTRANRQKVWTLAERDRWWIGANDPTPQLPLPHEKIAANNLPAAKERAVRAVQEFGVWVEASRASGIGRFQLLYLLRKETPDPEFRRRMFQARRECHERLEGAFIQRGMTRGGDLAGIYYLKHNLPKYREVSRIELTGKDGAPIHALDAAKTEMLARLDKLVQLAAGSAESTGSGSEGSRGRKGLEGREEIVLEPRAALALTKGSAGAEVRRAGRRKEA